MDSCNWDVPERYSCILCSHYTPYFQIPYKDGRAHICGECFKLYFGELSLKFEEAIQESKKSNKQIEPPSLRRGVAHSVGSTSGSFASSRTK